MAGKSRERRIMEMVVGNLEGEVDRFAGVMAEFWATKQGSYVCPGPRDVHDGQFCLTVVPGHSFCPWCGVEVEVSTK